MPGTGSFGQIPATSKKAVPGRLASIRSFAAATPCADLQRRCAKRWAATVGRPEIQKFAGALHGQHATKGIFITTSDFSRDANDYVSKFGSKIVLIDGSRLAELMIEFGVAVATDAIYTVKRIDNDFFESI